MYSLGVILYELYTKLSYSDGEDDEYSENFYTNENVEHKLNKNLKDEKYKNLKILLTGLLKKLEGDRWGWEEIFESEFYKFLKEKFEKN